MWRRRENKELQRKRHMSLGDKKAREIEQNH